MTVMRRLVVFFIALFLIGFYFGPQVTATFFSPGSEDDPLITKVWVDDYINRQIAPVHERALALSAKIKTLETSSEQIIGRQRPTIILTVGSKTGFIDEVPYSLDAAPFLVSGRILLPLRFVGEAFGVNFFWDEQTKTVTYPSSKGDVQLTIGKNSVQVGDSLVTLDTAGKIVAGRTFVPLRFIGESLGAEVIWHGEYKKAEIR